ncbi:hypothetical protein AAFF_G00416730 [Aldrovandia affinis]|uniref:Uncharacterized protein n=1 Tax=Aldrovandia affinis TaxID=143900 RepID=A0AAD7SCW5_9TELE|nr:hypothetical protein AAFF_G00416730 [Aldrovandia affinis]
MGFGPQFIGGFAVCDGGLKILGVRFWARGSPGPVSSVPAATAVGWDWWKKRLSNLPLARQHLGNRLALCYYP